MGRWSIRPLASTGREDSPPGVKGRGCGPAHSFSSKVTDEREKVTVGAGEAVTATTSSSLHIDHMEARQLSLSPQ